MSYIANFLSQSCKVISLWGTSGGINILASLTPTQQRTLRLAATECKQIFAKEHLAKYEISSSPALSSAIKSLKDKEILDEEGAGRGTVIFDDPFFAIWLRIEFNG